MLVELRELAKSAELLDENQMCNEELPLDDIDTRFGVYCSNKIGRLVIFTDLTCGVEVRQGSGLWYLKDGGVYMRHQVPSVLFTCMDGGWYATDFSS